MIRINLLPGARRQSASTGGGSQGWIIAYLVAAVLTIVVLVVVYMGKNRVLEEQRARCRSLTTVSS